MGTCNFYYLNRCVVVENDDIECDNYPIISNEPCRWDRNYPSYWLKQFQYDFTFWDVVMTYGYYEHACIDYMPKEKEIYDFVDPYYYATKKDLFNAICEAFDISRYKLNKIFGKLGNKGIEDYFDAKCDELLEYLVDKEEKEVNKIIDNIKEVYGYKEYRTIGCFSNGEAVIEEVG